MDKKLLKIILSETVIGFGLLFWYKSFLSGETGGLVEAAELGLIFILTVGIIAITLIAAFVMKFLNRDSAILGVSSNRYGLKFWAIIIICVVVFIASLPYIIRSADKIMYSSGRMNCIQVITRARQPKSGEIRDFPTPCDVPDGWEKI
ncbi:MAG: hypothetical protein Q7S43_00325 [bacterium]|nr:hypothetical protein [bacterium]